MTQLIPERVLTWLDLVANTLPPRDPNNDDDNDEEEGEDDDDGEDPNDDDDDDDNDNEEGEEDDDDGEEDDGGGEPLPPPAASGLAKHALFARVALRGFSDRRSRPVSHQRLHHPLQFMKRTDATSSSHCQAHSYAAASRGQ